MIFLLRSLILLVIVTTASVSLLGDFWRSLMSSSTTVALEQTGYAATYSVAWGFGMNEKMSVARVDGTGFEPSSGWTEIVSKPYNSGMFLYRSVDGKVYYIGQGMGFYRFVPSTGEFQHSCSIKDFVVDTRLGAATAGTEDFDTTARKASDPGAPSLQGYLDPNEGGAIVRSPPASKYYENLVFLGRFGIRSGGLRGSDVGFVSMTPEPVAGLGSRCP